MNSSLSKQSHTYKEILLSAFPEALRDNVSVVLGILPVNTAALTVSQVVTPDDLIQSSELAIKFDSELLNIPSRIYFNEPDPMMASRLTDVQRAILNCIYLRHHSGYVRQNQLEELLGLNEDWIIPHTLHLLGDYVLEILQVLNKVVTDENIQYYRKFIEDNPKYWRRTVSRMISYWNCYYRRKHLGNAGKMFAELKTYPGMQIVERLADRP